MQRAGFLLWLLVCAVLVLDIGIGYVRAQKSTERTKTQEVDIVNPDGTTVIQIANTSEGPVVSLCDPSGKQRLAPGVMDEGGGIAVEDTKGDNAALLSALEGKDGLEDNIEFTPAGQGSVALAARKGYSGIEIDDKAGKQRTTICYDPNGDMSEFALESAKDQTAVFGRVWDKVAHVIIYDPTGAPRASLGLETNDNAYFAIGGENGGASWEKTFDAGGSPSGLGHDTVPVGSSGTGSGPGTAVRRMGSP